MVRGLTHAQWNSLRSSIRSRPPKPGESPYAYVLRVHKQKVQSKFLTHLTEALRAEGFQVNGTIHPPYDPMMRVPASREGAD